MENQEQRSGGASGGARRRAFPLEETAQMLNDRYGLYMSEGQRRGLAVGLMLGAVLTSAMLAWGVTRVVRESDW